MFNLVTGTVLVLITAALYWKLPPDDQPNRILDRWGLRAWLSIAITGLGVTGTLLIAKSLLSYTGAS